MELIYGLLFFVAVIAGLAFLIQKLAKAGLRHIERSNKKHLERNALSRNPFVRAHMQMLREEHLHDEYIEWMDKYNVPGVPFEKTRSAEQAKADKKINSLFR